MRLSTIPDATPVHTAAIVTSIIPFLGAVLRGLCDKDSDGTVRIGFIIFSTGRVLNSIRLGGERAGEMTTYIAIGAVALLIIGLIVLNWEWVKTRFPSWWASIDKEASLQAAQRAIEELVLVAELTHPASEGMSKHAYVKSRIQTRFPGLNEAIIDLLIDGAVRAMNRIKTKNTGVGL